MDDKVKERFFTKVNKTDECWLWTSSLRADGYGEFCVGGITKLAHRISWIIAANTIPDDKPILRHKCRNRSCVRPEHLEVGTNQDNSNDMKRDGTDNIGERNPRSKLTAEQVLQIRARATEVHKKLADEFGVGRMTITDIINRRKWKHI